MRFVAFHIAFNAISNYKQMQYTVMNMCVLAFSKLNCLITELWDFIL